MRTKIILGGALAVLLVGLGSYFLVKSSVERAFTDEVDTRIGNDFRILERSIRLSARDLLGQVNEQADARGMADVFGALDENGRRTRAFEATERIATWFQDPARGHGGPPDLVTILDDQGHIVARNLAPNVYGTDLGRSIAAVRTALTGDPAADVWQQEDEHKVLLVAAAPIRGEGGRVVGVLLVGYDLSNGFANSEAAVLGRDVAFVSNDTVYSASFDGATQADELRTYLFGEQALATTTAARDSRATSAPWIATLGGVEVVGVVGPLPLDSASHVAMVVAADRSAQSAKASVANLILVFTLVGLVIVLVYGFVLGASLLKPIEAMEESILAIINGRTDLRIQIESAEFGGLAYRINQLLNVLTGTAEADESGRISHPPPRWDKQTELESTAGESPASGSGGGAAGGEGEEDPALAAQLAAEPEDAYYTRVYNEYVAAKQAAGENVSNIPQDKFVQRLKANEAALVKKHGCRMVRFQVQVAGTQVNLKPVIIR
jgi:HAMP domain-containing protein